MPGAMFLVLRLLMVAVATTRAIRILPSSRREDASFTPSNATASSHSPARAMRTLFGATPAVHVPVPTDPADHLVSAPLPLMQEGFALTHWAGHLPASADGDKYLFYWLFAPDLTGSIRQEPEVPLIVWLNGGPACSSMDGLFIENGPLRLTVDPATGAFRVTPAQHSWHRAPAYTLYVDQPVGTGLSWTTSGKYPRNDSEVNADFYYFLQQFFTLHKDKFVDPTNGKVSRNLFFSGESYAGHYIPSMMNYILKQRDAGLAKPVEITVRGGAVRRFFRSFFLQMARRAFSLRDCNYSIAHRWLLKISIFRLEMAGRIRFISTLVQSLHTVKV
jgi:Serine carboxypeptidase